MNQPKTGFNKTQSYIEFETTSGFARLGIEGTRVFLERYDFGMPVTKTYVTNDLNEITALVNSSSLKDSVGTNQNITLPTTKRFLLTTDQIAGMFVAPVELIPAVAGVSHEFISAVLLYNRSIASFGAGGDVTIRDGDNAILSTTITAANSFLNAANAYRTIMRLTAAGGYVCTPSKNLRIQNATAAFTKGTAEGYAFIDITYQSHIIGF